MRPDSDSHLLVICEKPDAARRVAEALADGSPQQFLVNGVQAFRLDRGGRRYVVCAGAGHLYGVSDVIADRRVYPVFDLEWFPISLLGGRGRRRASLSSKRAMARVEAIASLAKGADGFVNACDFDIEGETIGHNIIRYVCGGGKTLRARFSTLTKEDIVKAFDSASPPSSAGGGLAAAGRLRHFIDFVWGINLSRAISESAKRTAYGFATMSIGRVQGPTLNFVVEKETAIRNFVPKPYWTVEGTFAKGLEVFRAACSRGRLGTADEAQKVKRMCEGKKGLVARLGRRTFTQPPSPPLNLADLQKEAYSRFGYAPSRTLRIAERLYLAALISYPRTSSQKLPKMNYAQLLRRLGRAAEYREMVDELLSAPGLQPREGDKSDSAHPAIYPTGERGGRARGSEERRILDLVTRRFIACFAPESLRESTSATVVVGGGEFEAEWVRVLSPGWLGFYWKRGRSEGEMRKKSTPQIEERDEVDVVGVDVEKKFTAAPSRYNQSSLLEKMEAEGLGTKATRADTISTLIDRGYLVSGNGGLSPTELGFSIVEAMQRYCPRIVSLSLTRDIEKRLEVMEGGDADVDGGEGEREFFEGLLSSLMSQVEEVKLHEPEIAGLMKAPLLGGRAPETILGACPVCRTGKLIVIKSSKTGKRFVGCTNYSEGCKASAPLPQRGSLRRSSEGCEVCAWPAVYVGGSRRRAWRLCVNPNCPQKAKRESVATSLRASSGD